MRLLIPTNDTNGASAQLSGHFGRAPFDAIADTEADTVVVVDKQAGVPVYVSDGPDVASAIASFHRSSLRVVGSEDGCSGSGSKSEPCGGHDHAGENN
jgi:predicted Fe-Mo cluster-binding NifX family protein